MLLHAFMKRNREAILERSASTIRNRSAPLLTEERATSGLPLFYDQVIEALHRAETAPSSATLPSLVPAAPTQIGRTAARHATELHRLGFNITQVVHIYGTICESVTQVAEQQGQPIGAAEFKLFNCCLDDAVAQAVEQFEHERDSTANSNEVERLGFLAHELRNALFAAMMSFQLIKDGAIGCKGRTARALERNLGRMRVLIDRSLTEVRLRSSAQPHREAVLLGDVLDEIEVTAHAEAEARGVALDVKVEADLEVSADRHMLVSAIANLVQNGLRFTPAGGSLSVRASGTGDCVSIEVQDQCGGLPAGKAEALSSPSARGSADRSGLGLGVAIAHRAIRLHGGEIRVRDVPGQGCIFTIQLPARPPGTVAA